MSLEDTNEPLIQPPEQKMADKSYCESCCECFGKIMDCCLPCGLICILLEK
jgi:hypothetical protein